MILYSPLLRAKQTAEIAFKERNIQLVEEKGLIERNFGKLDGMSLEEIKIEHPEAEEFYHGRTTEIEGFGVEPIPQLKKRSFETLERIVQQNQGKTIALTGHLFWIKSLISTLLKKPYSKIAENYSVKNASITTINATANGSATFTVEKVGDKSHLTSLKK